MDIKNLGNRAKETTTTTGTGTYNLAGAPSTKYITLVLSLTRAQGGGGPWAKVPYVVSDGVDYEIGLGTVTNAAPDTLFRDTVLESSNLGAAVDWGAGTRDVIISPSSYDLAMVDDINTFTGMRLTEQGSAPSTSANEIAIYVKEVGGASEGFIRKESSGVEIPFTEGNSLASEFASGVTMLYGDASPPTAWTQAAHDDEVLRVVSGAGGGTGGSASIAGGSVTSGGGTNHDHTFSDTSSAPSALTANSGGGAVINPSTTHTHDVSGTTGGESAHTHDTVYNIKYRDVILATKD